MALIDRIKDLFRQKYTPVDNEIKDRVPFFNILGYEKNYGVPTDTDFARQVKAYKSWVYACAWKNATSVAKCKLCLYKTKIVGEDEELTKIGQHPFLDVISSVNPFSNRFELLSLTQIYLELTGNAYWWIPKNVLGVPYMIWVIPAHWVKIVPSAEKFIEGYVVQVPGKGQPIPFEETEVIHFKYPNPFNIFYGTGPTLASAYGIDLNEQIRTWGINYFMNNAQPSGALMTEGSLSPEQYQRLRDRWNMKHKGTQNAGKIAILEAGMKYEQIGSSIRDARFEEVTKDIRDEILAIFGVPASKLGLVEDVNRANAEANDYTYQKETIVPRLSLIEEKLNEKMIPIYDVGLKVKFENPVPEDREYRLREKQINIQSGFSSIDEEREKEGLEPFNLPETSVPLISFGLAPAGQPREDLSLDFEDEEDEEDEKKKAVTKEVKDQKAQTWENFVKTTRPIEVAYEGVVKRFFKEQHSEVIRRLNNFKSVQGVNKDLYGEIVFDLGEQIDKLKQRSKPSIRRGIIAGLKLGVIETNSPIDFNLFEPNVLRYVEERAEFVADRINSATKKLLSDSLKDALAKGESIADVSKRVDSIYGFSENFRSKRIAQTEIIGATNQGKISAFRESGIENKKWLTAGDEKVRESHVAMDKQVVGLEDSFISGGGVHLQYPGDRSSGAPAEEIINCRCTVVAG